MTAIRAAYIVSPLRTPVGKAPRGMFRRVRPDDLLVHCIRGVLAANPGLDPARIEDLVVGCAMPEGEQGLNVARMAALVAGLPDSVPGMTVNRFCSSGLQAIAIAADRVRTGDADLVLAGGVESMSLVPMGGHHPAYNAAIFARREDYGIAYGMGITGEKVAEQFQVSREEQDAWAAESHARALAAIASGEFAAEILPYEITRARPGGADGGCAIERRTVDTDEGPRPGSTPEVLAKLRPVFAAKGSVTAGNSSQMSDGAALCIVASEAAVKEHGLAPVARLLSFRVAGVPPEIMGIGPKEAVPKALAAAGLALKDMDWIELNEAFAAQTIAVVRALGLDPATTNPLGGAIALGHPLGCTGAKLTATALHGLARRQGRYALVTMCIGTGMGAAGIFERL
ncbi:MAG TPA: acetyl-CoA C-acyltransferase [Gammaproteobacteria bacterium]|nr:acetyl-CoA C-acyltransferase [Gammaproteobacteria bacterium]